MEKNNWGNKNSENASQRFDLTEESSKRTDEEATEIARNLESDDINEGSGGNTMDNNKDSWTENKVSTSLDDE